MAFGFEFPHVHNYDSDLREVLYYLKKLEAEYANIESLYDDIKKTVDEINAYYARIPSIIDKAIQDALDDYSKDINEKIANMEDLLESFQVSIVELQKYLMKYTDDKVDGLLAQFRLEIYQYSVSLQKQIDELEKKFKDLPNSFYVYCQPCGWHKPIQHALDDIYNSAREPKGLTVAEYDSYGMSVKQYDDYNMTVIKYAMMAKAIIHRFWYWHFNPITGTQHTVANIASWLATLIYNTETVQDYEDRDITVEEYDELDITVFEYLTYHSAIAASLIGLGGLGLTVGEYQELKVVNSNG